jgi:hypothetical protein
MQAVEGGTIQVNASASLFAPRIVKCSALRGKNRLYSHSFACDAAFHRCLLTCQLVQFFLMPLKGVHLLPNNQRILLSLLDAHPGAIPRAFVLGHMGAPHMESLMIPLSLFEFRGFQRQECSRRPGGALVSTSGLSVKKINVLSPQNCPVQSVSRYGRRRAGISIRRQK